MRSPPASSTWRVQLRKDLEFARQFDEAKQEIKDALVEMLHERATEGIKNRVYQKGGLVMEPVFDDEEITLQSIFMCFQVFSAAVIGYVESRFDSDAEKNEMCQVVPHPEYTRDYVAAITATTNNAKRWGRKFPIWLRRCRLFPDHHEPLFRLILSGIRSRKTAPRAEENMRMILAQEFPEQVAP